MRSMTSYIEGIVSYPRILIGLPNENTKLIAAIRTNHFISKEPSDLFQKSSEVTKIRIINPGQRRFASNPNWFPLTKLTKGRHFRRSGCPVLGVKYSKTSTEKICSRSR